MKREQQKKNVENVIENVHFNIATLYVIQVDAKQENNIKFYHLICLFTICEYKKKKRRNADAHKFVETRRSRMRRSIQ